MLTKEKVSVKGKKEKQVGLRLERSMWADFLVESSGYKLVC
jgi:hypothetical protein